MPTFRRLFFRCTNNDDSNLYLDVLMDDRRHWIARVPACGWWGAIASDSVMPFVLRAEDRIDFGSYVDDETGEATCYNERFAHVDFADRILTEGERFTLIYDRDRYEMVLEKVTDVANL